MCIVHVNEMVHSDEVCTIQTAFEDLRLYFCLETGHQVSGVHAPSERLALRTEKVTYTTLRFFENYQQILVHASCNLIKSIAAKNNGAVTWHVRTK